MFTKTIEALQWRYATAEFDKQKKVSDSDLQAILEAGNLMPSSFGLQPYQVIVVSDQSTKDALAAVSSGNKFVASASHLLIFATSTKIDEAYISEYTSRIETTRSLPKGTLDGFKKMMVDYLGGFSQADRTAWAKNQTYGVLGGITVAASTLGVDDHAYEWFDSGKYNEILKLAPKNLTVSVCLALGHRAASDATSQYKKVRKAFSVFTQKA